MFKFSHLFGFSLLLIVKISGQSNSDSIVLQGTFEEMVVTATKQDRLLSTVSMPVQLIKKDDISKLAINSLSGLLSEASGLIMIPNINGIGSGLQVQGFNPEYTLILLNGEPMIGRSTGVLDLNRFQISNIKKIEIVKGPSSSLYGSEALAGVVNIITDAATEGYGLQLHTRGNHKGDHLVNANFFHNIKTANLEFFSEYGKSFGYDLQPEIFGKTVSPSTHFSFQSNAHIPINKKVILHGFGRIFNERLDESYQVNQNSEIIKVAGTGNINEYTFGTYARFKFTPAWSVKPNIYYSFYKFGANYFESQSQELYLSDAFQHQLIKPDLEFKYQVTEHQRLLFGIGNHFERVLSSRYQDNIAKKQDTKFAFAQYELHHRQDKSKNITTGLRLDHNPIWGVNISPKLSGQWPIRKHFILKSTYGMGFKSPDFRQLYLNFQNAAAGGYQVLGTEVINEKLVQIKDNIQSYFIDPNEIGKLQAERSNAINLGIHASVFDKSLQVDINSFYNSINNLIETQVVALTKQHQSIYSYRNIKKAITYGMESNISYQLNTSFKLSTGYQLLFAKDKDILRQVKDGKVFWRDPETLVTKRLKTSEYFGLGNRSRHMLNAKLFYTNPQHGWDASLRVIYRSKFGLGDITGNIQGGNTAAGSDINSNGILDNYDRFIKGYTLTNISCTKTLFEDFKIHGSIENIFDYKNIQNLPNIQGRVFSIQFTYLFHKNINHE